jgi:hypothetical protein
MRYSVFVSERKEMDITYFKQQVENCLKHNHRGGSFLDSVMSNNLAKTVQCADPQNLANLKAIVAYVKNLPAAEIARYNGFAKSI